MSNGRLGGSATIGGYFQQKMDEIKGVDQERAKQDKLKRVAEKIHEVRCCGSIRVFYGLVIYYYFFLLGISVVPSFMRMVGWEKKKKWQEMEGVLGEALRSPLFFILWVMGPGSPDQKIKDPSTILTNPTCFYDSFIFPALFLFLSA